MFADIIEKEQALHDLLPDGRLQGSSTEKLLLAAKAWSNTVWDEAERLGSIEISAEEQLRGRSLIQFPIFICGVHRSGTTLVRDLLDGHPNLLVLPSEGTYYTNLEKKLSDLPLDKRLPFLTKEWLRRMANPINQAPYWILGRTADGQSLYVCFVRYCVRWGQILSGSGHPSWPHLAIVLAYASCTGNHDALWWVDKTPANENFLNRIWREMPKAKIIYVLRDPTAIISSRKKLEPGYNAIQVIRQIQKSLNIAWQRTAAQDSRFKVVRYEDLSASPLETMKELVSFLGIKWSESASMTTVAGMATRANSSFIEQADPGSILKPGQHAGEENLNQHEKKFLSAFVGKQANRFQYSLEEMSAWERRYWKIRAMLHRSDVKIFQKI
jgi:hypothetical protein